MTPSRPASPPPTVGETIPITTDSDIGLAICADCGAAILVDPPGSGDAIADHAAWHQRMSGGDLADAVTEYLDQVDNGDGFVNDAPMREALSAFDGESPSDLPMGDLPPPSMPGQDDPS